MSYCPKCKSLLYPADEKYIVKVGVCSGCVTWDDTPDKLFKYAYYGGEINGKRKGE